MKVPEPAPACRKALIDATALSPNRNRAADGIMGDLSHQARASDHNDGNAFDLTHDPENFIDCNRLSLMIIRDHRVKYVIWNSRIYNTAMPGLGWRIYNGRNKHNHHMHVSIHDKFRNDLSPWTCLLLSTVHLRTKKYINSFIPGAIK